MCCAYEYVRISPPLPNTLVLCIQGILSDLFPGVVLPEHDYGRLQLEIEKAIVAKELQVRTYIRTYVLWYVFIVYICMYVQYMYCIYTFVCVYGTLQGIRFLSPVIQNGMVYLNVCIATTVHGYT